MVTRLQAACRLGFQELFQLSSVQCFFSLTGCCLLVSYQEFSHLVGCLATDGPMRARGSRRFTPRYSGYYVLRHNGHSPEDTHQLCHNTSHYGLSFSKKVPSLSLPSSQQHPTPQPTHMPCCNIAWMVEHLFRFTSCMPSSPPPPL